MRALIQRCSEASVIVEDQVTGQIGHGLLVFLGIEESDERGDADWLSEKIRQLRIFSDDDGKMNLALSDVGGDILLVSQFTLHANTRKGNRPSFIRAARPEQAIPLYEYFRDVLSNSLGRPVASGIFGADMRVALVNDGPVTIWIDTKNKE